MTRKQTNGRPDDIRFRLKTFTDSQIEKLLEDGENFRMLKTVHRDQLAAEMLGGDWDWHTGETLGFTSDGRLVNGQHRLAAAQIYQRETGAKAWFWCAIGVTDKNAESMDRGRARTAQEYLVKHGVTNAVIAATIARMGANFRLAGSGAMMLSAIRPLTVHEPGTRSSTKRIASVTQILKEWRAHSKEIEEWATVANRISAERMACPSMVAGIGYILSKDRKTADFVAEFFRILISGESSKDGCPVRLLRERLIDARARAGQAAPSRETVMAWIIKAWCFWMQGRSTYRLFWAGVGPKHEKFPDHRNITSE